MPLTSAMNCDDICWHCREF